MAITYIAQCIHISSYLRFMIDIISLCKFKVQYDGFLIIGKHLVWSLCTAILQDDARFIPHLIITRQPLVNDWMVPDLLYFFQEKVLLFPGQNTFLNILVYQFVDFRFILYQ